MNEIKIYPASCLFKKAQIVTRIRPRIRKIAEYMVDLLYRVNGIGLAANQIGVLKRIIVIREVDDKIDRSFVMINPEIIYQEGSSVEEEGCLSLPGIKLLIQRYQFIKVQGCDIQGNKLKIEADNFIARVIQHEIDHLNGILIIDKVNKTKRKACIDKLLSIK
jgi:peptide deformylase